MLQNQQFHLIYQSLSSLSVVELDELMTQILYVRKQKLPNVLGQSETELLQKINKSLPPYYTKEI
jgi:hypothetical protein